MERTHELDTKSWNEGIQGDEEWCIEAQYDVPMLKYHWISEKFASTTFRNVQYSTIKNSPQHKSQNEQDDATAAISRAFYACAVFWGPGEAPSTSKGAQKV